MISMSPTVRHTPTRPTRHLHVYTSITLCVASCGKGRNPLRRTSWKLVGNPGGCQPGLATNFQLAALKKNERPTTRAPGEVKSSAVVGDKYDQSGNISNELYKVDHRLSLVNVLDSLSADVHVTLVHTDLVNVASFRVDGSSWPDVSTEQRRTAQRRNLHYVAVELFEHKHNGI